MQYIAPIGAEDPNDSYINANPATGTNGSKVPAEAIEHPMREIMYLITQAGLEGDDEDLTQLHQAVNALIDAKLGFPTGTVVSGYWAAAPEGFLDLNGAAGLSRVEFATLFTLLNDAGLIATEGTKEDWQFGSGDGSTTFSLADVTDFARAKGSSGRALGALELDQMQRITGSAIDMATFSSAAAGAFSKSGASSDSVWSNGASSRTRTLSLDSANSPDARTSSTTDGETRPRSITLMFAIKY